MMASFTDKDNGYKALKAFFASVDEAQVTVGIHEDADDEVAVIAASHEFGTERIPERSFLRSTADANARIYADETIKAVANSLAGQPLQPQLDRIGRRMVNDVKTAIRSGIGSELQPETVERKGHDTPLIDSERMINSITYRTGEGSDS